jgi:hypothetical protein
VTTRESIHELVDRLPDEALSAAEDALRCLAPADDSDDFLQWLRSLPEEDEDLSPRELEAVRRHNAGVRSGRLYSHAELLDAINASARE